MEEQAEEGNQKTRLRKIHAFDEWGRLSLAKDVNFGDAVHEI